MTGSPGTGKNSIGHELADLMGLEFFSINEFAIEAGLGKWRGGEFLVDTKMLKGKIDPMNRVVSGHLLPYVVPDSKLDFVAILRCSPKELRRRCELRGYARAKIAENLEAEMIGVVAVKSLQEYGRQKVV